MAQPTTGHEHPPTHLSPTLKHLISHSRYLGPTFDPPTLDAMFARIHHHEFPVGQSTSTEGGKREEVAGHWLVVLTGALFALNAVDAIPVLYRYARAQAGGEEGWLFVVERMREVGLKTVSFMGVPRAINCLAALAAAIREQTPRLNDSLPKETRRELTAANLQAVQARGRDLWDDIYAPHHEKLLSILARSHPDLPTHIIQCHYSALLSPFPRETARPSDLDRVQSSVLAVACLRALGGVDRQVESHLFGLKKARGGDEWIASDDGCVWLLRMVDEVVDVCRGVPRR